jgi:threonine dehydratase
MFELSAALLAGSIVVGVAEVAEALRLMVERNHVVAEGAGATPVAAARTGKAGSGKVACVVSGGNIDASKVAKILEGGVP